MFPRPAAPIFCSVSRVSEATLDAFFGVRQRRFSVLFLGFQKVLLDIFLVGFSD